MAVAVAVAAAATSAGNQDITSAALMGNTPKLVLLLYSRAAADGTINANAGTSWGMATSALTQYALATFSRDGVTTSTNSVARLGKSGKCLTALHYTAGAIAVHSECALVSMIPDGIRVNWTTASSDAWLITAIFFEGSDWTVQLGDTTTTTSGVSVSTGSQPDAVLLWTVQNPMSGVIDTTRNSQTFGATTWSTGSAEQRIHYAWSWGITRQNVSQLNNDFGGYQYEPAGLYGIATTRSATGFTVTKSGDPATTTKFVYLAINYGGSGELKVGHIRLSTASGAQAITGLGGQTGPFAIFFPHMGIEESIARNVWQYGHYFVTAAKYGGYSIGSVSDTSLTDASHAQSHHSTHATDKFRMLDSAGVENARGTFTSFDVDGFTLNFSDVLPQAEDWLYFTIVGVTPSLGKSRGWIID